MSVNLGAFIYTSADYKITLSAGGVTVPLNTVESFDYSRKEEAEVFHAIGNKEPIGIKKNTATYDGKLSIQAGELDLFLTGLGLLFASQIEGATIAIIGGATLIKVFKNVALFTHEGAVKVKDKQSLINISFMAQGVSGI